MAAAAEDLLHGRYFEALPHLRVLCGRPWPSASRRWALWLQRQARIDAEGAPHV